MPKSARYAHLEEKLGAKAARKTFSDDCTFFIFSDFLRDKLTREEFTKRVLSLSSHKYRIALIKRLVAKYLSDTERRSAENKIAVELYWYDR